MTNPIPFPTFTLTLAIEDLDRCIQAFRHELDQAVRHGQLHRQHECETVIATLTNLRSGWLEQQEAA